MKLLVVVVVFGFVVLRQPTTAKIYNHLEEACKLAWPTGNEARIERCSKRAMAVMGDSDRLRDNQLKALLVECEGELLELKESR